MWDTLLDDLALLSLDAGDTIVYFDARAAASEATREGFRLDAEVIDATLGSAKRALDAGALDLLALDDPAIPAKWGAFMRWLVARGGEPEPARSADCVRALWRAHQRFNLWRRVPDGLADGLRALRASGLRVVVVS